MKITYYGYPKCSTCRKAKKWLTDNGIDFAEVNLVETPPTAETLQEMIATSGLDIKKFFNVSGKVYREQKLKDKLPTLSDEEKVALLASNGMLIKRPIVFGDGKTTVGFKEETFDEVWG
ncbi:arsenate reductase family protein [Sporosarcina ureilytica]|nr:arsenate reductase family protein [Sporosarcina ureilytica]